MREVDCICGERIVFLDEEVQVKTCTNCGMQVYQYETPRRFETVVAVKKRRTRSVPAFWTASFLVAVLMAILCVAGFSVVRSQALERAGARHDQADEARDRGDFYSAAAAYEHALAGYSRWGGASDSINTVTAALGEVRLAIEENERSQRAVQVGGGMPISLEELARQAYLGDPQGWQAEFDAKFAGRWVMISGRAEERKGRAFKASALTVSYRALGPAGRIAEISFDSPFFERYRLKAGTEFVIRAVLSKMRFEQGGAGDTAHWVLEADGKTSAFVTEKDELRKVGWDSDEQLAALVARQGSLSPAY